MHRWLLALVLFGACAPFGAGEDDPPAAVTPAKAPSKDAGAQQGDASMTAPFCSSQKDAAICEDFEGAALNPGWDRKTSRGLLKQESGVGRVVVDQPWEVLGANPAAEDYLDYGVVVDPAEREVVALALDFSVAQLPSGQFVEIAKLSSDTFNFHIVLQRSDNDPIQVVFGQYSSQPPGLLVADQEIMKITDTGWHHVELRLTVGNSPDEKNLFWVKADAQPEQTGEIGEVHATTPVSTVNAITGLSFVGTFVNPFDYAVDNVVVVNTKP